MKTFGRVTTAFVLGLLLQGGMYYYLDQVYFAPNTEFSVVDADEEKDSNFPDVKEGKKYYSQGRRYMAVVTKDSLTMYEAKKEKPITIDVKGRQISYFEWMSDRQMAIVGLYGGEKDDVVLARIDPEAPDHEIDTTIKDLPTDSRITDVAYSAATNVVYMKIRVDDRAYRIYRTDANYDTRRVYMQASDIGRIDMFYDEDRFFYDNVRTGDVFMFNGTEGGWRVINPAGRYRLIGVSKGKDLYIVKVNDKDEALSALKGRLGVGFETVHTYESPTELHTITIDSIEKNIEEDKAAGRDPQGKTADSKSDSKDSKEKDKKDKKD